MVLLNQRTGYSGFTLDGLNGIASDTNGSVKKCIFSIVYQLQSTDIDFTISDGLEDWCAQMGDGSIIPLHNPKVLYQNRDNSIVEFDMESEYPANSPCLLIYKSNKATFNVREHIGEPRPFTENTLSGHFAFTTEGYNGGSYENGLVDRIIATVPFPLQLSDIEFTISAGDDHWGARMGDGSIINLKNPEVIATNKDNAVIKFDMETPYPSNSPCIIVYRSGDARFNIKIVTTPKEFVPVTNIIGVPEIITAGEPFDLSSIAVFPTDATIQGISWSVISGNATIVGDTLYTTSSGNVTIAATVIGGASANGDNFTKEIDLYADVNSITIVGQPPENILLEYDSINGSISVNAKSNTGMISYKWYRNHINGLSGAVEISNGNKASYQFPANLATGVYYYFCEISSPGATTVRTNISKVTVITKLTGIDITPKISSMNIHEEVILDVSPIPSNSYIDMVTWSSSNSDIIQVDKDGKIHAVQSGSATITAKTIDNRFSDSITISIAEHIPVSSIDNIITEIDTNTEYVLSATVNPSNASNKTIIWDIIDDGNTGASIVENKLIANKVGIIVLRATIDNGASISTDYTQNIIINVNQKFVPVSDVTIELPSEIRAEDKILLNPIVSPPNATNHNIEYSIIDDTTGLSISNGILSTEYSGTCTIKIIIKNGISNSQDYIKDIKLIILPKWIPVTNIIGIPTRYEDVSIPLKLNATVYPSNATSQEIIYTLENPSSANATMDKNNTLYIDYENVKWWNENPNPLPDYSDKWLEAITDSIVIGIRVPNGVSKGVDYVTSISIGIQSPSQPSIHIPIESINLILPSIVRARRPILLSRFVKEPWNATNGDVIINPVRADSGQPGFAFSFKPGQESEEYWKENYNINFDNHYDWNLDGFYLYIFEHLLVRFEYTVLNGMPDGTTYHHSNEVEVLPEYIPVKNISNIPSEIPYDASVLLNPEFDTQFPITIRNTETYDVEIPSYSDVNWKIIDPGVTGAQIIDGVLSFIRTGTIKIEAEVPNGTHEAFNWYGNEHKSESYKQQFEIKIVAKEIEYDEPVIKLTLNNGTIVNITKDSDIYNISNDKPSDAIIKAGGVTFRKDQVISIDFWDTELLPEDNTVPVNDITLSKTSVETYELVAPTVNTSTFANVTSADNNDGCILIEDINHPLYGGHILPDKVFLHDDGTIIRHYISTGSEPVEDLILNIKYADNVFTVTNNNIQFPDSFIRYDNGYIEIPAGTILDTNGDLVIVNTEGINVNELYRITTHGIVFDNSISRVLLPNTTTIKNESQIRLPDGYVYNIIFANTVPSTDYSTDTNITIPYGSYINSSNNICILPNVEFSLEDIEYIKLNENNFIKLLDGSVIFEDGSVYMLTGKLFDVYAREIDSNDYINITSSYTLTPNNATNQSIVWNLIDPPSGTKLITIPTDIAYTNIVLPGNTPGYTILEATVPNGFSVNNNYSKKLLLSVGDVSNIESKIVAINIDADSKTVLKGYGGSSISFTASLVGTDANIINECIDEVEWSISGSRDNFNDTKIIPTENGLSAEVTIGRHEPVGNILTVTIKCRNITTTCDISVITAFTRDVPYIECFANFARNFTNLTSINHIPESAYGDDCLRNFMAGCTSFNKPIKIPEYIGGNRCLKGFLSGCTSFNQSITIPNGISGEECLSRFLSGCTSFNKSIVIPEGVTGDKCLMRFLEKCSSFNQDIIVPNDVSGKQCLDHFMYGCEVFNKPITIPSKISGVACMRGFMRDTYKMTSDITISTEAANNCEVNGLTLVCFKRDDAYDVGIHVIGSGADIFKDKCVNMTTTIPLRKLI